MSFESPLVSFNNVFAEKVSFKEKTSEVSSSKSSGKKGLVTDKLDTSAPVTPLYQSVNSPQNGDKTEVRNKHIVTSTPARFTASPDRESEQN